jgi:hypothetical protein
MATAAALSRQQRLAMIREAHCRWKLKKIREASNLAQASLAAATDPWAPSPYVAGSPGRILAYCRRAASGDRRPLFLKADAELGERQCILPGYANGYSATYAGLVEQGDVGELTVIDLHPTRSPANPGNRHYDASRLPPRTPRIYRVATSPRGQPGRVGRSDFGEGFDKAA